MLHDFCQKYQKYLKIILVCSPKIAALVLHSPCRPDMQKTPATLLPTRSFNSKRVDVGKGQRAARAPESLPSKKYGLRDQHFLHEKAKNFLQNSNLK